MEEFISPKHVYDALCRAITDYENSDNSGNTELYTMLVNIQAHWDLIRGRNDLNES